MSQNNIPEPFVKNLSGIYKISTYKLSNEEIIQMRTYFDREKHIVTDQPVTEIDITNGTVAIYNSKDSKKVHD